MSDENTPLPEDRVLDENPASNVRQDKEVTNSKSVYEKLTRPEFLRENQRVHRSSPRMESISAQLDEILAPPSRTAPQMARDMATGRKLDYRLLQTLTKNSSFNSRLLSPKVANTIRTSATLELLQFQRTVARNYMRKNLSLAYRQAVTLGNISATLTQMGTIIESKLDAIKVNTGHVATATAPEPTLLDRAKDAALNAVKDVGMRQARRSLSTYARTGSLNQTYQGLVRDIDARVGQASRSWNSFRGRGTRDENLLSPIRRGLSRLRTHQVNDEGMIAGAAGAAVPLLRNFRPELFSRERSDAFVAYSKERKTPTFRLMKGWRDEQMAILHQILDRLGPSGGGHPSAPSSPVGPAPSSGPSGGTIHPFPSRGGPSSGSYQSTAAPRMSEEEEDRQAARETPGPTGMRPPRHRMDETARRRWGNTRARLTAILSDQNVPLDDVQEDAVAASAGGGQSARSARMPSSVARWVNHAQRMRLLSQREIQNFHSHAQEHGYRAAMRTYASVANSRARESITRVRPTYRVNAQRVSEIRAYASQHGAMEALRRYGRDIRNAGGDVGADWISRAAQAASNRQDGGATTDGYTTSARRRSYIPAGLAGGSTFGAAAGAYATRSGVHQLHGSPYTAPHSANDEGEYHHSDDDHGGGSHFFSNLFGGALGEIAAGAGGALLAGSRGLYRRFRARGGGYMTDLHGNRVETRTGRLLRRMFGSRALRDLEKADTPAKRSIIRTLARRGLWNVGKASVAFPFRATRFVARGAWRGIKTANRMGVPSYLLRSVVGRTSAGRTAWRGARGLLRAATWVPRKLLPVYARGAWAGARGLLAPRSAVGRAAMPFLWGALLNNAQNNVDGWTQGTALHDHLRGIHAALGAAEWGTNALSATRLLGMTGSRGRMLAAGIAAAGGLSHYFPSFGSHLVGSGMAAGGTYGLLKLIGKSNTRWGRAATVLAGAAPFLSSMFGHANAAEITSPHAAGVVPFVPHPLATTPTNRDIDLREQATTTGTGSEFLKASAEDLLLVQAAMGLMHRGGAMIDNHLGAGSTGRLARLIPKALAGDTAARGDLLGLAVKAHMTSPARPSTLRDLTAFPTQTALRQAVSPRVLLGHLGTGAQLAAGVGADWVNQNVVDRYIGRTNADGTRNRTNQAITSALSGTGDAISLGSTGSMFGARGREIGMALGAAGGSGILSHPGDILRSGAIGLGSYALMRRLGVKSPTLRRRLALAIGVGGALPGLTHTDTLKIDPNSQHAESSTQQSHWGDFLSTAGIETGLRYAGRYGRQAWQQRNFAPLLENARALPRLAVGGMASAGGIAADLINNQVVNRVVPLKHKDGSKNGWNSAIRTIVSMSGNALAYGELGGTLGGPWGAIGGALGGAMYGYYHEHPQQINQFMGKLTGLLHKKVNQAAKDAQQKTTNAKTAAGIATGTGISASQYRTYVGPGDAQQDNSDITKDPSYKAAYNLLNQANKKRMDGSRAMQFLLYSYAVTNTPKHAAEVLNQRITSKETDSQVIKQISAYRALHDQPNDPQDSGSYIDNVYDQENTAQQLLGNPGSMTGYQERVAAGGIGLVSAPPPPKGVQLQLCKTAIDIFTKAGYPKFSAVAMAANDRRESMMNKGAVGDGGLAYGICQWHPDRRKMIEMKFGKPMQKMSFEEQCQAQVWEIQTNPKGVCGGTQAGLMGAKSLQQAVYVLVNNFERPADRGGEVAVRTKMAQDLWDLFYNKDGSDKSGAPSAAASSDAPASTGKAAASAAPADSGFQASQSTKMYANPTGTSGGSSASASPAASGGSAPSKPGAPSSGGGSTGGAPAAASSTPTKSGPALSAAHNVALTRDSAINMRRTDPSKMVSILPHPAAGMGSDYFHHQAVTEVVRQVAPILHKQFLEYAKEGITTFNGDRVDRLMRRDTNNRSAEDGLAPTFVTNAPQTNHYHIGDADQVSTQRQFKTG